MWRTFVKNRIEFYPYLPILVFWFLGAGVCSLLVKNRPGIAAPGMLTIFSIILIRMAIHRFTSMLTRQSAFPEADSVSTPKRIYWLLFAAIPACCLGGCGYTAITFHSGVPVMPRAATCPRAIVVYDSWSGNTELVAKVIAAKLGGPAVHVMDTGQYTLENFDLIVVGSPVHEGFPTRRIVEFLDELAKPSLSAVFVTFGAPGFGPFTANLCLKKMEKKLQGTSLGRFKCHGFHQIMRTYPDHPSKEDEAEAARFAAGLLERCGAADRPKKNAY